MTCDRPLSFEVLAALWAGELEGGELEQVEAHLFACDPCARAADRVGQVVDALRDALPPVISHARRDRLVAAGTRIATTVVDAGIEAHARFAPDLDLLVHVLRADVARAERVDVELVSADGSASVLFEHVPFDRARGEVLIACHRHYQEFPFAPIFRVHAVTGGERKAIGDYIVHHEWQ